MKSYLVLDFSITPAEGRDIVLAALADEGFDSFEETEKGLKAYIADDEWQPDTIVDSFIWQLPDYQISYTTEKLEQINWNEEWERHYDPILVDGEVYIYAPFHPKKEVKYALEIVPKMSFGTGHHHTTRLMLRSMLSMALAGKSVLDMGTGTGVLAIMAEKLGANPVRAIDNYEWAVENTRENIQRNDCKHISTALGDASALLKEGQHYNAILANINRNVLLEDMATYVEHLTSGGHLLMSGFFKKDASLIEQQASALHLNPVQSWDEEPWTAALFTLE